MVGFLVANKTIFVHANFIVALESFCWQDSCFGIGFENLWLDFQGFYNWIFTFCGHLLGILSDLLIIC